MLSAFLLLVILATAIMAICPNVPDQRRLTTGIASIAFSLSYTLRWTRYSRLMGVMTVGILVAIPFGNTLYGLDPNDALKWLAVSIVTGGLWLSSGGFVVLFVVIMTGILSLPLIMSDLAYAQLAQVLVFTGLVSALILTAILFRSVRRNQIARQTRALEQEVIERKAVEVELQKHQNHLEDLVRERTAELRGNQQLLQEFSRRLIESQEAERKRVAADLHDDLGQNLLIINNEIRQLQEQSVGHFAELQRVSNLIQESIHSVREIASNLHPHHLDRLGLRAALEAMVEKLSRSSVVLFHFAIDEIDDLFSKDVQINIYRIVQEAVSNIERHSGATEANIHIRKNETQVHITIRDNGKGFDKGGHQNALVGRQGLGACTMTERVKLIDGTMEISSAMGCGTAVQVNVPVRALVQRQ